MSVTNIGTHNGCVTISDIFQVEKKRKKKTRVEYFNIFLTIGHYL